MFLPDAGLPVLINVLPVGSVCNKVLDTGQEIISW